MRRARAALVGLVLSAGVFFLGPAAPACACSCASRSAQESFADADAVFVGVVTDLDEPGFSFTRSSADPVTVTFAVSEAFKNSVPADARVVTVADGASCGYNFHIGGRYLVFARADDGVWRTGLCDGNQTLAAEEQPSLIGGYAPAPATGAPGWPVTYVVAVIGSAAVLAALGLRRWLRRRAPGGTQKSA